MKTTSSFKNQNPKLYLVSTPIGNLNDITLRAIETLKRVSLIFAEDTRVSGVLLKHFQINTRLMSYYEYNKESILIKLKEIFNDHNEIALISDAGTPLISDPGSELIKACLQLNINIIPIPGASSILAALVASGIVPTPFTFLGFIPKNKIQLRTFFHNYLDCNHTLVFFDSPNRINKSISYLKEIFMDGEITLAREITKIHEQFIRSSLQELDESSLINKGEYVVVFRPIVRKTRISDAFLIAEYENIKSLYNNDNEAIKELAKKYQLKKSEIYHLIKIKLK